MKFPPYFIDPYFATGMDTSDQTSDVSGSLDDGPSTTSAFDSYLTLSFQLFGNGSQLLIVHGHKEAMDTLMSDMADGSMYILPQVLDTGSKAVTLALRRLQLSGNFPQDQEIREFEQQWKTNPPPVDDTITPTVYGDLGPGYNPEFLNFNVSLTLQKFRRIALMNYKEFEAFTPAYHLGVVTHTKDINKEDIFHASLFHSGCSNFGSSTIWLYRTCYFTPQGRYFETWNAFGTAAVALTLPPPRSPTPEPNPDPTPQKDWWRESKQKRQERLLTGDLAHLTNTQILNSSCLVIGGDHAEIVSGPVILKLAREFRNREIFERVNRILLREGRPPVRSPNVITRRITLALDVEARKLGFSKSKRQLREELNAARRVNLAARLERDGDGDEKGGELVRGTR